MERLQTWFAGLSMREQWLVGIAATLPAILLLIFGIILPGLGAVESARLAHGEAVERRGRIEAKVASAKGGAAPGSAMATDSGASLDLIVTQSAAENGFELVKSPSSNDGQFAFRMEKARASALLVWIDQLGTQGVEVKSLTMRRGATGTVIVDTVMLRSGR